MLKCIVLVLNLYGYRRRRNWGLRCVVLRITRPPAWPSRRTMFPLKIFRIKFEGGVSPTTRFCGVDSTIGLKAWGVDWISGAWSTNRTKPMFSFLPRRSINLALPTLLARVLWGDWPIETSHLDHNAKNNSIPNLCYFCMHFAIIWEVFGEHWASI